MKCKARIYSPKLAVDLIVGVRRRRRPSGIRQSEADPFVVLLYCCLSLTAFPQSFLSQVVTTSLLITAKQEGFRIVYGLKALKPHDLGKILHCARNHSHFYNCISNGLV